MYTISLIIIILLYLSLNVSLLQVLASFLTNDTTNAELPLLVNFEAKTMFENYPLARSLLLSRLGVSLTNTVFGGTLVYSLYCLKVLSPSGVFATVTALI